VKTEFMRRVKYTRVFNGGKHMVKFKSEEGSKAMVLNRSFKDRIKYLVIALTVVAMVAWCVAFASWVFKLDAFVKDSSVEFEKELEEIKLKESLEAEGIQVRDIIGNELTGTQPDVQFYDEAADEVEYSERTQAERSTNRKRAAMAFQEGTIGKHGIAFVIHDDDDNAIGIDFYRPDGLTLKCYTVSNLEHRTEAYRYEKFDITFEGM